jgi:hypothetical protein
MADGSVFALMTIVPDYPLIEQTQMIENAGFD